MWLRVAERLNQDNVIARREPVCIRMKDGMFVKWWDDGVDTLKRNRVCSSEAEDDCKRGHPIAVERHRQHYAGFAGCCRRVCVRVKVRCDRSHVATEWRDEGLPEVPPGK